MIPKSKKDPSVAIQIAWGFLSVAQRPPLKLGIEFTISTNPSLKLCRTYEDIDCTVRPGRTAWMVLVGV